MASCGSDGGGGSGSSAMVPNKTFISVFCFYFSGAGAATVQTGAAATITGQRALKMFLSLLHLTHFSRQMQTCSGADFLFFQMSTSAKHSSKVK